MSPLSQRAFYASMSLLTLVLVDPTVAADETRSRERMHFFEQQTQPVLARHCCQRHSPESDDPGGRLQRKAAERGGETGPAVVPGELETSLIHDSFRLVD